MDCDVVVLGGGPAGEAVAARAAGHGLDVVLVERELIGGECAFWACMPSKALLRPGELLDEVRRVPGVREAAGPLDAEAVLGRRDEVVRGFDDAAPAGALEKRGIRIVRGHGRLAGERRVEVGQTTLEPRRAVVLAPGSAAAIPPIDGLAEARPWTSREGTTAREVPGRLVVLGGGVVGVELAQAWSSLGATVTLLEAQDRLLGAEEEFAGELVATALHRRGVDVRAGVTAEAVRREAAGVTVALVGGEEIHGDEILVAAGRRPRVEELGLEALGLATDGPIEVDDRMQVAGHPWLYAIGDVNGRALLTHAAKYQARVAADVIAGRDVRAGGGAGPLAPRVIFTDPGVAAIGHTLASAQDAGLAARAVDHPTDAVPGGSFHAHGEESRARLVIDEDRGVVAGATFVAPEVAELIHAATIAVSAEVPLTRLWEAVPAFPTRSEVWLKLLEKAGL